MKRRPIISAATVEPEEADRLLAKLLGLGWLELGRIEAGEFHPLSREEVDALATFDVPGLAFRITDIGRGIAELASSPKPSPTDRVH